MSDYIKREDALFVAYQQPFSSAVTQIKMLDGIDIEKNYVPREFHDRTCEAMAKAHQEEIADMVSVVRCKECRHWCNHKDADYDQSEFTYYCEVHGISLTGNDFCSYGEREGE